MLAMQTSAAFLPPTAKLSSSTIPHCRPLHRIHHQSKSENAGAPTEPRQLMQSDQSHLNSEERRKRRVEDRSISQGLAASAIERAQLRHRLRLQPLPYTEPDQAFDSELSAETLQAPPATSAIDTLKQQCCSQPLLNREEELSLAQTMAKGRECCVMLEKMGQPRHQNPLTTLNGSQKSTSDPEALHQLHAAEVAKRKLMQANLRLVLKAVLGFRHQRQVNLENLVQAGLYGLSRGLNKYDPDRGNRVSTVAYVWIREAVGRAYNESARTIKISERMLTNMRKITAAQDKHQTSSLSVTTPDQGLQQLAGLSQQTFASAMRACKLRETSLEAAVDSFTPSGKLQTGTSLIDQISSTFDEEFDSGVVDGDAEAEAVIEGALQQLPEAEATVIHHVYGLQDGLPKSRPQVAKLMGMGLHHIRKLEQRALSILRTLQLADAGNTSAVSTTVV